MAQTPKAVSLFGFRSFVDKEDIPTFGTGINHPYLSPLMTPFKWAAKPGKWALKEVKWTLRELKETEERMELSSRRAEIDIMELPFLSVISAAGGVLGMLAGGGLPFMQGPSVTMPAKIAEALITAGVGAGAGMVAAPAALLTVVAVVGGAVMLAAGGVPGIIKGCHDIHTYRRALKAAGPQVQGRPKNPSPKAQKEKTQKP